MQRPQTSPPLAPPPAPPATSAPRTDKGSDVVAFLDRAGLGEYLPVFFSHGYTTTESLYTVRPEDLQRMQVNPDHQRQLRQTLDELRSASFASQASMAGMQQVSPGFVGVASGSLAGIPAMMGGHQAGEAAPGAAAMGSLGPHAYTQQPPYQKGGLWVDTGQEAGYQWVDGPGLAPAAAAPALGYPVDQSAVAARAQQQPPGGMPLYHYPQAGTQWVDGPSGPPAQPVQQDVVFQWVDSPNYGRSPAHQQHYLQAQAGMAQYPGPQVVPDATRYAMPLQDHGGMYGHALPPLVQPGSPHQDLAGLGYDQQRLGLEQGMAYGHPQSPMHPGTSPPQAAVAVAQYSQRRDLQAAQYGQPRQPQTLQMEDIAALRMGGGPGAYGSQAASTGSYQLFDQPPPRARGGGARPVGPSSRGARGGQQAAAEDAGSRGRGRQAAVAERQATPDQQFALAIESLGPDGLTNMLTSTLESLYEDRIKPMGNYVKGRMKERSCPEQIIKIFVEMYAQHADLFVVQQATSQDEATILFVTEPPWFKGWVDIDDPSDPYDESMWEEFTAFLSGEHTFAGGRYGMARELMQRSLPFLAPHSLGEVCHIVQLAIQHRRLIVYHRKMLKPIQTVLSQLTPAGNGAGSEGEDIKDMDDLCLVLFRMLMHHPQGIRLCRMKQMIKHEFCRKLSEMAFQCTKLIELFSQEPLAETFVLDTENDGKSIYVRLGNPDKFTQHVKRIYAMASSAEAKQVGTAG